MVSLVADVKEVYNVGKMKEDQRTHSFVLYQLNKLNNFNYPNI